ncbi:MAG: hypothetical protein R3E39_12840 [Anaerolineae bacterium]
MTNIIRILYVAAFFCLLDVGYFAYKYGLQTTVASPSLAVYQLDVYNVQLRVGLTCFIIPALIAVTFMLVIVRKSSRVPLIGILLLLIFATVLAIWGFLSGILRNNYGIDDPVCLDHRVYYALASYGSEPGLGDPRPLVSLYECDEWGVLCRIVHTYGGSIRSKGIIYWSIEKLWNTSLLPDPTTNSIVLQINGETVYTHQVE